MVCTYCAVLEVGDCELISFLWTRRTLINECNLGSEDPERLDVLDNCR